MISGPAAIAQLLGVYRGVVETLEVLPSRRIYVGIGGLGGGIAYEWFDIRIRALPPPMSLSLRVIPFSESSQGPRMCAKELGFNSFRLLGGVRSRLTFSLS